MEREESMEDIGHLLQTENIRYCSLLDTIIGSKQVRYGPRPSIDNCNYMQSRIDKCISDGRPIEILTSWGANKGYGQFPIQQADLLDVMAIHRFVCLQTAVQGVYWPGIRVTVFMEDYTDQTILGHSPEPIQLYHDSLVSLISCLGMEKSIRVVRESSLIPAENREAYQDEILRNTNAIYQGRGEDMGWVGNINWPHYLKRTESELPSCSSDERKSTVSLFLGSVLTRGRHKDMMVPPHDLKLSFVPYPKGVPDSLRKGRLEYKVKVGKNYKCTPAPWTCFGLLRGDNDWTVISPKELRAEPSKYRVVDVMVNGGSIRALRET